MNINQVAIYYNTGKPYLSRASVNVTLFGLENPLDQISGFVATTETEEGWSFVKHRRSKSNSD